MNKSRKTMTTFLKKNNMTTFANCKHWVNKSRKKMTTFVKKNNITICKLQTLGLLSPFLWLYFPFVYHINIMKESTIYYL